MFQGIAIVLIIIFYCIYYGKLLIQKKQGIITNQLKQQGKSMGRTVGILMSLATLFVPVGEVVSIILNMPQLPFPARVVGVMIALAGDIIFYLSVSTMGNSWRAGVSENEKTQLVTHGIYSISRNPAFLAFDLVYVGILLIFFSWWLLALTLFAMIMLHLQVVLIEEPFLPKAFGEEYVNYSKKVCRYLGRKR